VAAVSAAHWLQPQDNEASKGTALAISNGTFVIFFSFSSISFGHCDMATD
jgi:hypothetical protein